MLRWMLGNTPWPEYTKAMMPNTSGSEAQLAATVTAPAAKLPGAPALAAPVSAGAPRRAAVRAGPGAALYAASRRKTNEHAASRPTDGAHLRRAGSFTVVRRGRTGRVRVADRAEDGQRGAHAQEAQVRQRL
jgi:hypothetical protein